VTKPNDTSSKAKAGPSRRTVLAGSAAAFALPTIYVNRARAAETLVVRDPGGPWAKAGLEAFYKPFTKETGIEIVQVAAAHEPISQVKAMVDAKSYTWDVVILTISNQDLLGPAGYLEELDLSAPHIADLIPKAKSKWFVGTDVYSTALAYRTDTIKRPMTGWADVWNVKDFPGRRSLRKHPIDSMEQALLADGVAPDKLYPLDADRAFKKLNEIKKDVQVWWTGGAQASQLLKTGEVDVLATWNGRSQAAIDEGAPAKIVWNQGLYSVEGWTIPKGNPKAKLGMRLIQFTANPERQAEYAKHIAYGPTNPSAYKSIAKDRAAILPTNPDHFDKLIYQSHEYWGPNQEKMIERFNAWILT
jgi:putative spermidine/putrescine transport system substrate-binding protein